MIGRLIYVHVSQKNTPNLFKHLKFFTSLLDQFILARVLDFDGKKCTLHPFLPLNVSMSFE